MSEPDAPQKPDDLIQKAYEKLYHERAFALNLDSSFNLGRNLSNISPLMASPIIAGPIYQSIDIENNIVDIQQKQGILHTKFDWFPGGYVVPMQSGEYEAKITIMCAEYEVPEKMVMRFIVEE